MIANVRPLCFGPPMLTLLVLLITALVPAADVAQLQRTAPTYLTTETAREHFGAATVAGITYGIEPALLLSIAWHESRFRHTEVTLEAGGKRSCGSMTPSPQARCSAIELTVIGGYLSGARHLRGWIDVTRGLRTALLGYAGGYHAISRCKQGSVMAVRSGVEIDLCRTPDVFLARSRMINRSHGTTATYKSGCRCDQCREANRVACAKWSTDNRTRRREIDRARHRRNRDRRVAISRAGYLANKDSRKESMRKWYQDNKVRKAAVQKAWKLANPEKVAAGKRRYEWHRKMASGRASDEQIAGRIAFHGERCVYCGDDYAHLDHAIPLSRGGTNWPANLWPACASCNLTKGTKTAREFMAWRERRVAT